MKSSAFGERTGTLDYQTTKYLQEKSWLILQEDMLPIMSDKRSLSKFVAYLCDPNCRPYRYVLAIFLSMIEGMLTFCADFPAGIQSTTIKVMKLDNTKYNMLFSAYTWPDIVMSILGTVMVGKYLGMRRGNYCLHRSSVCRSGHCVYWSIHQLFLGSCSLGVYC